MEGAAAAEAVPHYTLERRDDGDRVKLRLAVSLPGKGSCLPRRRRRALPPVAAAARVFPLLASVDQCRPNAAAMQA